MIKKAPASEPVLRYYDVSKPVTIQADASQSGLGCCLLQEGRPVHYPSRAMTDTEKNYAQIEKELLATCLHLSQVPPVYLRQRGPRADGPLTPGGNFQKTTGHCLTETAEDAPEAATLRAQGDICAWQVYVHG